MRGEPYTISLDLDELPPDPVFEPGIRRAPRREAVLSPAQERRALKNALRYIPAKWHERLAPEFLHELRGAGASTGTGSGLKGDSADCRSTAIPAAVSKAEPFG